MNSDPSIKKILILSANPKGTDPLRLDEEIREIKERLRLARKRDQFTIDTVEATRVRDICQAMLDFEPNIVHFSGHGAREEGLVFEDKTGHVQLVSGEALADLFKLFADKVECVLLNACYSEVQAEAIAQYIPYVVGMNKAIGDRAAIEFAVGFYSALGAGYSYEFAHRMGCVAIQLEGIPEHLTPQLLGKGREGLMPPETPEDIQLTGSQRREFREALMGAYSQNSITMLLQDQLNINLSTIAKGTYYEAIVFNLINYFQERGQIINLLEVACKERPRNAKLQQFYQSVISELDF
jgi:hypothetical protein